jgi:hypothetical protein
MSCTTARLEAIRARRAAGYQLDAWDADLLLHAIDSLTVERDEAVTVLRAVQTKLDRLERRVYARPKYLGDRR